MLPNTNTLNWYLEINVHLSLVYVVQICSSIRKHLIHIHLQLSGCVVIAEKHAWSNKVFSLHEETLDVLCLMFSSLLQKTLTIFNTTSILNSVLMLMLK